MPAEIRTCQTASRGLRSLSVKFPLSGRQDRRRAGELRRRISRPDAGGIPRVPPGPASGSGHRQAAPDALPRFLGGHPVAAALRPAPDAEADTGQLCPGELPRRARVSLPPRPMARAASAAITSSPRRARATSRPRTRGKRSANFLRDELEARLRGGPRVVSPDLADGRAERSRRTTLRPCGPPIGPRVELGRLEVTSISPTGAADERKLVFDPDQSGRTASTSRPIRFCSRAPQPTRSRTDIAARASERADASIASGPDLVAGVPIASMQDGVPLLGHARGEPWSSSKRGADLFAVGATCTHYGGPLAEGLVVESTIRCPWHHACFDLRTGKPSVPALQ